MSKKVREKVIFREAFITTNEVMKLQMCRDANADALPSLPINEDANAYTLASLRIGKSTKKAENVSLQISEFDTTYEVLTFETRRDANAYTLASLQIRNNIKNLQTEYCGIYEHVNHQIPMRSRKMSRVTAIWSRLAVWLRATSPMLRIRVKLMAPPSFFLSWVMSS